jgi:DNA-binding MarR family transcriptional regulator
MSNTTHTTSEEMDIASLLVSLTRSMYRTMRTATPTCSFLEIKTLNMTHEQKNPSMKDLADELGISSPAMTAIVDRLVENGNLTRAEDQSDRRVIRISLTTKGKKDFEKNRSVIFDAFNERASVLSDDEKKELARILRKLNTYQ